MVGTRGIRQDRRDHRNIGSDDDGMCEIGCVMTRNGPQPYRQSSRAAAEFFRVGMHARRAGTARFEHRTGEQNVRAERSRDLDDAARKRDALIGYDVLRVQLNETHAREECRS